MKMTIVWTIKRDGKGIQKQGVRAVEVRKILKG
jgi:hypothetical protein